MHPVAFTPDARRDMHEILAWTHAEWGAEMRLNYEALIKLAVVDLSLASDCNGSKSRPELAPETRTYHLKNSRIRAARTGNRIKTPRHFLLYRVNRLGQIEIGRILHDSMDPIQNLPEDFSP